MILQFDNKQLQVFNDILERQILKAKDEATSSNDDGDKASNKNSSSPNRSFDLQKSSPSAGNSNDAKSSKTAQ